MTNARRVLWSKHLNLITILCKRFQAGVAALTMPLAQDLVSFLTHLQESKKEHNHRLYAERLTQEGHRLETIIRTALAEGNYDKIGKIVKQLCQDYAYAVHQPHARNGGLIGLAAAAIALGSV